MASSAEITFRNITKRFGDLVANDNVSFEVASGAIHGVVGENGAGKSTIMKVLYGLYPPDSGEILVKGSIAQIRSPLDAIALGIGMVHQHFMLVPSLPVWKNVILGAEPSGIFSPSKIIAELDTLQRGFGLCLDLTRPVETLSVGEQQQVEILKLLYRRADILILDEPTAVLTPQEVDQLFARLQELNRAGKTIILITHKLHEILRFTSAVTVMRQGKAISTVATSTLNESLLAELIIGRTPKALSRPLVKREAATKPVLAVRGVSLAKKKEPRPRLSNISLEVLPGEIVGIAGISGNGQEALIEVLNGLEPHHTGEIFLQGEKLESKPLYQVKQSGYGLIPADRNEEGLIGTFPVRDNLVFGHHREAAYHRYGFRSLQKIREATLPLLDQFDIRPRSLDALAGRLSGGNQQKVIIAREVKENLSFLLAAYPTRGVDIGAIEMIYELLLKKKSQGAGILLISCELDELFALSDRILVFFEGKIQGEVDPKKVQSHEIGLMMTGGKVA